MTSQDLDQTRKKAEFDRLMTAASVHRRRGDYVSATQAVKEALQISPDDLDAREFAADMIYAHGDVKKASEHYKALLEIEPSRASAEGKYAKAVLELSEAERQRELLKLMVENPGKYRPVQTRNPNLAVLISVVAPGFGHIYCGQYYRGMAIFGGWLLSCVMFLLALDPSAQGVQKVTLASAFLVCMAGAMHIYAMLSVTHEVDKANKDKGGNNPSEPE